MFIFRVNRAANAVSGLPNQKENFIIALTASYETETDDEFNQLNACTHEVHETFAVASALPSKCHGDANETSKKHHRQKKLFLLPFLCALSDHP